MHPVSPRNRDIGRWDPQDGVTYEVAEAVLGELIGHCSGRLYKLETAGDADPVARQLWLDLVDFYARKRRELTLRNMPAVRAVIDLYGPVLRRIDRQSDA